MKPHHRIPLLGLLGSFVLSLLLIHFVLVDVFVWMSGASRETCYGYAVTLLTLLTVVRAWRILKGKDEVTQLIDRWMKK